MSITNIVPYLEELIIDESNLFSCDRPGKYPSNEYLIHNEGYLLMDFISLYSVLSNIDTNLIVYIDDKYIEFELIHDIEHKIYIPRAKLGCCFTSVKLHTKDKDAIIYCKYIDTKQTHDELIVQFTGLTLYHELILGNIIIPLVTIVCHYDMGIIDLLPYGRVNTDDTSQPLCDMKKLTHPTLNTTRNILNTTLNTKFIIDDFYPV